MVSRTGAIVSNVICTSGAFLILALRLAGSIYLRPRLDVSSYMVIASMIVSIVRAVLANTDSLNSIWSQPASSLSTAQLSEIKETAIRTISTRILITTFYWLQVSLLLLFYSRLLETTHASWKKAIHAAWVLVIATYLTVVLITGLECRPFRLYWQTGPPSSRPQCQKAYAQLFAQGVSNIVLDLVLLAISLPILKITQGSKWQCVRVAALYCLGFVCVLVTSVRIANTKNAQSSQTVRSMWASLQELVSAFVANMPTVYGNMVLIMRKKRGLSRGQRTDGGGRQSTAGLHGSIAAEMERGGEVCDARDERPATVDLRGKHELDGGAWSQHVP